MLHELNCRCEVIKNFIPSWFASVMGTGILALVSLFYSEFLPFLAVVSRCLFYFNIALFTLLLVPWLLRWIMFPTNALSDLRHPVLTNFYPTIAIGMLVLSADFIVIGNNILLGEIFWFVAAALTIYFAILVPYIVFTGSHVKLEHINPAWFIPPVGLIVIPIPGSLLVPHLSGMLKEAVLLINYFGWGAGFFLYLSILAISFYRFIVHHPLPNTLAPTISINLGPIGAGTVALISLVKVSDFIISKDVFFTFGLIFWGFGIWWVIMAIFFILHYIKSVKLPYTMAWWAFTFPLGAYVSGSHAVSTVFNLQLVDYTGFVLYWLLVFIWVLTLIKTSIAAYRGTLFKSS
ncbi:MAG: hypothetical protein J7K04_16450 [Spirochaetales bacterium]|nr:hypothetical protein [Spirochaetales bacterium]